MKLDCSDMNFKRSKCLENKKTLADALNWQNSKSDDYKKQIFDTKEKVRKVGKVRRDFVG